MMNRSCHLVFVLLVISPPVVKLHSDYGKDLCSQTNIEKLFVEKTSEKQNYFKWIKPEEQVHVNYSMEIQRYVYYQDSDSTLNYAVMAEFEWIDSRLHFIPEECLEKYHVLDGNEWHYSRIWLPNIRVAQNKNTNVLKTTALSQMIFLRIYDNGRVRVRLRINLSIICPMDYRSYPFDTQVCQISILSNELSTNRLQLHWNDTNPFLIDESQYMSSHFLEHYETDTDFEIVHEEQFSMLTVKLHLKRQWGHYMLIVFLPSMLIVATSWLAFWIEITSPPTRITLCVTTMLSLVTVSKEIRSHLPKVPYIKATDFWFAGCTVSIFFSLIEYIYVAYTFREEKRKLRELKERKRFKRSCSAITCSTLDVPGAYSKIDSSNLFLLSAESYRNQGRRHSVTNSLPTGSNQAGIQFVVSPPEVGSTHEPVDVSQLMKDTPQEIAESIDRKCRILFPLFFALFNLIYWSYLS